MVMVMAQAVAADTERYRVGYALEAEKVSSVVQPSLIDYAKKQGVDLIEIDLSKPLIEQGQGPFNCIIHKLYTQEWKKQLAELRAKHPDVGILDPPELIEPLHNRVSMLNVVTQLEIPLEKETVGIPKQVVLEESSQDQAQALDLKFPLIAKPLLANGNLGSHELSLVFDHDGLKTLSKPLVLQEFVNHGGVIFKVYVAGQRVTCVKRQSLPDVPEEKLGTLKGTLPFSLISSLSVQENGGEISQEERNVEKAEMPSESLTVELARALREATGLNLFNVDVIRDANDSTRYLVIDINYCPGYAKLPSYESFFTGFLLDLASK